MSRSNSLPFDLGETYFLGNSNLISASLGVELEGKEYVVKDNLYGTHQDRKLRVVRNMNASRLVRHRGVCYGATAGWLGRKVRGYVLTSGQIAFPVDGNYVSSIAQYDLFYVVVEGPARCSVAFGGTHSTGITAQVVVSWMNKTPGGMLHPAKAGDFDLGMNDAAVVNSTVSATALVFIGSGFADKE